MIKRPATFTLSFIAALFFMVPAVSMAQDSPPPLAEVWMVSPKADHGPEFYKALTEHMAFRSEHGDPRSWQSYSPLLGDDLNRIAIRYCCFSWADQDTYREWSDKAETIEAHFNEHVAPHADRWEHYFEQLNWENSHWVEEGGPYKFFAVTEFFIKPGHAAEFNAARDKVLQIALNQGWATDNRPWLWSRTIGGKPQEAVIIPYKNFAGMDQDEENFSRFLSEQMGEEAAAGLMKQFSNAVSSSNFQIWEHQEKYSMSSED